MDLQANAFPSRGDLEAIGKASDLLTRARALRDACHGMRMTFARAPSVPPGAATAEEIAALRKTSLAQGMVLDAADPSSKTSGLENVRLAGKARVPLSAGLAIGSGETRAERLDLLMALRDLHARHGHIQEIIIRQSHAEADDAELIWTVAMARLAFGPAMNIQASPGPNENYEALIGAGVNDWGGVTSDDDVETLRQILAKHGYHLVERLAAYPAYCLDLKTWQDPAMHAPLLRAIDASGYARSDEWTPGSLTPPHTHAAPSIHARAVSPAIARTIGKAQAGSGLSDEEIALLFDARGDDFDAVCAAADDVRKQAVGDTVRYVVNRNINYTNLCTYKCGFCAFAKGRMAANLRGTPYDLSQEEITRRAHEAWARGATEVCMQGGIHPDYTGDTYLTLCRTVHEAVPGMHIHAFSPLEVTHGATTLGLSLTEFLMRLKEAGLGSLPGTAAEVLDDPVRDIICPDKLRTQEWLDVIEAAHRVGLRTTSTIMYGHVEHPIAWARHLNRLRALQERTGGFTEFVPLPFIPMEAPIYLRGKARKGPTFREAVLMHAVSRLALHPLIPNIQASWVKMGPLGVVKCLQSGANDLGGTLMNESISHSAGAEHDEELPAADMDALIASAGRVPRQRITTYEDAPAEQQEKSYHAEALAPLVQTPFRRKRAAGLA
jgi:FO synthase